MQQRQDLVLGREGRRLEKRLPLGGDLHVDEPHAAPAQRGVADLQRHPERLAELGLDARRALVGLHPRAHPIDRAAGEQQEQDEENEQDFEEPFHGAKLRPRLGKERPIRGVNVVTGFAYESLESARI